MNNTKTPIKESRLLQYLVQDCDNVAASRNAVLECVCKHNNIPNYKQYINDEARLNYIYRTWQREDDLFVELYSRKEYDPEKDDKIAPNENKVTLRQPRMVVYTLDYSVITPVSVVDSYIRKKYAIFEEIYFSVKKR